MLKKVNVIGMGCITPIGNNIGEFISVLNNCVSLHSYRKNLNSVKTINQFSFSYNKLLQTCPQLDIACQYILEATDEAIKDAGINFENFNGRSRIAVIVGTTFNIFNTQENYLHRVYKENVASPLLFKQSANNLLSGIIAHRYGLNGFNMTISNGWTSGLDALIMGQTLISCNQADLVIVGAVDTLNQPIFDFYEGLQKDGFLKKDFVAGEGCGVVVLEAADRIGINKPKTCILETSNCNCFTDNDVRDEIRSIFKKSFNIQKYISNFNKSIIDNIEEVVLEHKQYNSVIDIKPAIGECGAASGILQLIYSAGYKREVSSIFNVCFSGHTSCILAMGM